MSHQNLVPLSAYSYSPRTQYFSFGNQEARVPLEEKLGWKLIDSMLLATNIWNEASYILILDSYQKGLPHPINNQQIGYYCVALSTG